MPAPSPVAPSGPVPVPAKPAFVARAPQQGNGGKWIGISIFLIIAAVGGYLAYQKWLKPNAGPATVAAVTTKAFVGPLDVTIRLAGQTSARNFANIPAPMMRGPESRSQMNLLYLTKGGVQVKKGSMVAQIDAQPIQDRLDDLRDNVQSAENDVEKRRAEQKVEWEALQQTLRVSKGAYDKAKFEFQAAEVRTPIERELLKLAMDEAEAKYKQQLGDVEQRRKSQTAELRVLEINLDRTKRRVERFAHDLQRFKINTPMDGLAVISTLPRGGEISQLQQGDTLAPGLPLMKIVDLRSMQVDAAVSQADSGDLRVNQVVRVGLDAFSDLHFPAKIYSIGALAVASGRSQNYIRSVPVKVAIEGADPRLIPDLSAHCDVVMETIPNQLQVQLAGVHTQDGKSMVMVRNAEGWAERAVTIGKRNHTYVAVLSGLKDGEEIRLK